MRIFLKSFLGALLALVVFTIVGFIILAGIVGALTSPPKAETGNQAVLYLDLGQTFHERKDENPLSSLGASEHYDQPGIYDLVRLMREAKADSSVRGIYVRCESNPNGFATSEEIRDALIDFKTTGKFVVAYGDVISQKAYYVANVADKIYCNPKGGVDWIGLATRIPFVKGTLQKLEIEPQIFYAGKFKSATEPLREDKMTDANRLQTAELLNDLFNHVIINTAKARDIDTATLRKCVNEHLLQYAQDALKYHFVDALKYNDQVREDIAARLKLASADKINFVPFAKYAEATDYKRTGKDRIALIYAEGDIVSGKGDDEQIGDETYRRLIRTARADKDVKALVIRINSGGGSSLASENLWRELSITRAVKPVVISFGDVSASGAYYLSCHADSIFAEPTTITGSIGVFSIIPNMQSFFKDKLGVTFDGTKTAPDADILSISKPLTETQKRYFQNTVDTIYRDFKWRVAEGRKKSMEFVDSIGQGRVWSGEKGLALGLVDRIGHLQDAIDCAARMARTNDYRLKEYPEPKGLLDQVLGNYRRSIHAQAIAEELGADGVRSYQTLKKLKSMIGTAQARMPGELIIE